MKHCTPIRIAAFISFLFCMTLTEAKVVTESQALTIAERLISVKGEKNLPKRVAASRISDADPSTYYIFSGSNGKGFAIIAAEDNVRPILGYSADGQLPADGELPLPLTQWLSNISKQIQKAREDGIQQSPDVAEQWRAASVGNTVVQLETAQWGQGYPFNSKCPLDENTKSATGCVPTAYAILMRYYEYPERGKGNTPQYTTSTKGITVASKSLDHTYYWSNMPLSGNYSSTQANNIATLMADIGAALQVDYTKENTNGKLGQGVLFSNFDYHPGIARRKEAYSADEWGDMMRNELKLQRPIIYRAANVEQGGHAFMLDGYTDNNYFAVNWGWGGYCNGFFTLDALNPDLVLYDTGTVAYLNSVPFPMNDTACEASLNGQDYPTLSSAINDAPADGTPATINLLADVQAESFTFPTGKTITLDMGDHSVNLEYDLVIHGDLTVKGTEKSHASSHQNTAVFNNYGKLTIMGGTYKNYYPNKEQTDYRRCVWSSADSYTFINGGTFESPNQVICTNGKMTIEAGTFTCTGNSAAINNYNTTDTLSILGGTFLNNCEDEVEADYRRCLWATGGSHTAIGKATFTNLLGYQVLCFNGDAYIKGAVINSGNEHYGCLSFSNSTLTIDDCKLDAKYLFYADEGSQILCKGGLYSSLVRENFLAEGCKCVPNRDTETSAQYPYRVQGSSSAINPLTIQNNLLGKRIFNTSGMPTQTMQKGINIIRNDHGKVQKILQR